MPSNLKAHCDETDHDFYKTIKGEIFVDAAATKFDIRHFQVLDVKSIEIVLVSTFQELYGAPFLTMHPGFKGKIVMTQPLAQIGQNLLLELIKINTKRNQQKAQSINFLQQEQMFQEFSRLGLEDW